MCVRLDLALLGERENKAKKIWEKTERKNEKTKNNCRVGCVAKIVLRFTFPSIANTLD